MTARCGAIALNFTVRGLETDVLKRAMVEMDAELEKAGLDAFLLHMMRSSSSCKYCMIL